MRLGVVVALWGREALAQVSLTRYARAARGHDVTLVAVTDETGNGELAQSLGYEVVQAPNDPLSDKHNAGALHLRGRVDAMVVLGSDDWICDRLFGIWAAELRDSQVVGVNDAYLVCTHRPDAMLWPGYTNHRRGESIGVARAIRSDVLDQVDWQPWLTGKNKGLDYSMTERLRALGVATRGHPQDDLGVRVVGLKSAAELTSFERLSTDSKRTTREHALRPFPKDERAALQRICTY